MLFGLILVLNVSASSAASTNQTSINASDKNLGTLSAANFKSNVKTTIVSKNTTISNTTKVATQVTNKTTSTNSTKNIAAGSPTTVNGLTNTQLKDGISRAQSFYIKYGRLPHYISYGTKQIPISTFQQNIKSVGLKISTTKTPLTTKIDTRSVSALAKSLTAGLTTTNSKTVKIFNWVRDNINYSFYYNTKYGAAGTLSHRLGNCCDTANLLAALARDAGISARYVHGTCHFSSGWYGHVWAQLYVNGKWVTADATSSRNSLGVINNWNTGTYILKGIYNTLPF